MVAFVRRLPSMSPAQYRALVAEASPALDPDNCTGCHATDGRGRGSPDIPILGGQSPEYLLAALKGYASGTRSSAVMQQVAMRMQPAEMDAAARRFAAMPGLGATPSGDPAAARIVERGLPERQLPACVSCHTPGKPYPSSPDSAPATSPRACASGRVTRMWSMRARATRPCPSSHAASRRI